jgi:hypothetical protein
MKMANGFAIRISAVDGASKQIDAINRRILAMQAPADRMRASMERFSKVTGLTRLAGGFRSLGTSASNTLRSISGFVPGLAAITGAGTIAGVYRLATSWADVGTSLAHASKRLGMTTDQLQTYQSVAKLAGVSSEDMTSGLQTLGDTMQDAVGGRNPDALRMFNAMRINIRKSAFEAKAGSEVFEQVADRISAIKNPSIQAAVATRIFGGAAERLLPYLRKTRAERNAMAKEQEQYGAINKEGIKQAEEMSLAQARLGLAFTGLGLSLGQNVGPVLTPIINDFAKWIAANREFISTGIASYVQRLGDYLKSDGFKEFTTRTMDFIKTSDEMASKVGGWDNVLTVLFALWAGPKVIGAISAIGRMASALGVLGKNLKFIGGLNPWFLGASIALTPSTTNGGRSENDPSMSAEREDLIQRGLTPATPPSGMTGPTGNADERESSIYDALRARGIGHDEASGIVANAMAESGGDLTAINREGGGVGAHGLFQWRGSRARLPDGRLASQGTLPEQIEHFMRDREHPDQKNAMDRARTDREATRYTRASPGHYGYTYSHGFERHNSQAGQEEARLKEDRKRAAEAERIAQRQTRRRLETPPPAPAPAPNAAPAAAPNVAPSVAPVTTPGPGASRTDINGNISVAVNFANAPTGLTASATNQGAAFSGAPNISMGMSYAS